MRIRFRCPRCNAAMAAPDTYAGQATKCPSCQAKLRIPKPVRANAGHSFSDGAPNLSTCPAAQITPTHAKATAPGERRIVAVAVGSSVAILVVCTTVFLVAKHFRDKERAEELAALKAEMDEAASAAHRFVAEFEFDKALTRVDTIDHRIWESAASNSELRARAANALAEVKEAKRDYSSKVRQGWQIFEGEFISPAAKKRILEQRRETAHAEALAALDEAQATAVASDDWGKARDLLRAALDNPNLDAENKLLIEHSFRDFALETIIANCRQFACAMVLDNDPVACPTGAETLIQTIESFARNRWAQATNDHELPAEASETLGRLSADIQRISTLGLIHDQPSSTRHQLADAEGRQFFNEDGFLILRNTIQSCRRKLVTGVGAGEPNAELTPVLGALRDASMQDAVRMLMQQLDDDIAVVDMARTFRKVLEQRIQNELNKADVAIEYSLLRPIYYNVDLKILNKVGPQFQSWRARSYVANVLRVAPEIAGAAEREAEQTMAALMREDMAARLDAATQRTQSQATPKATADQYAEMFRRDGLISSYHFAGLYFEPTVMAGKILVTDAEYRTALSGLVDASIAAASRGGHTSTVISPSTTGPQYTETPPNSRYVAVMYRFDGYRSGRIVVERRGNRWVGRVATLDGRRRIELGG